MHGMNWDDLRLLLAVQRCGSLSGAARHLGINQSTVSRRVLGLEQALKIKLLERQPGGVALTNAARAFCALSEETESQLDLLMGQLGDALHQITGPLSIACVDMMADQFLAPLLADFQSQHPQIELTLLTGLETLDLMRGRADVALRVSRGPDGRLMGRRLCDFGLAVYAASGPESWPLPQTWIGWADGRQIDAKIPEALTRLPVKHQADSFLVMRAMVRAGLGLAVLPCYWADPDPTLQRAFPDCVSHHDLGLWLLYHPDRKQGPRLRAFVDFIVGEVLERRALFSGKNPSP